MKSILSFTLFAAFFSPTDGGVVVPLCFSGSSLVDVQDKGPVPLKDVQIGDKVHVGQNVYEPVYSFGHRDPDVATEFLKLETPTATLEVSPYHLVSSKSLDGFVPASHVRVGDTLEETQGDAIVQSISSVQSRGIYAPFTPSGKVVVNNVVASSYVAMEDQIGKTVLGMTFSYHWISHAVEFPHRVMCHYLGQCLGEQYDASGLSTSWVAPVMKTVQYVKSSSGVVQDLFFVMVVVPLLLSFSFVEGIILNASTIAFVGLLVGLVGYYMNSKKLKTA